MTNTASGEVATEAQSELEARPQTRSEAANRLAAMLLFMYGQATSHSRDLHWEIDGQTYTISRYDHTLPMGQAGWANTNWLHGAGDSGEQRPVALGSFADEVMQRDPEATEQAAEIICKIATQLLYTEASAILGEQEVPRNERRHFFTVELDEPGTKVKKDAWGKTLRGRSYNATFYDFTDNDGKEGREPFIWVRVTEVKSGADRFVRSVFDQKIDELSAAYDLTADELRMCDGAYPLGWPITRQGMSREELLMWFLRAVQETPSPYSPGRQMLGSRGLINNYGHVYDPHEMLVGHLMNGLAEMGDELATFTNPEIVMYEDDKRVVVQTIFPYSFREHGSPMPTLVGVIYEKGESLYIQLSDLSPRSGTSLTLNVNLLTSRASGMRAPSGEYMTPYRVDSEAAIAEIREVLTGLSLASAAGSLIRPDKMQLLRLNHPKFHEVRTAHPETGPRV